MSVSSDMQWTCASSSTRNRDCGVQQQSQETHRLDALNTDKVVNGRLDHVSVTECDRSNPSGTIQGKKGGLMGEKQGANCMSMQLTTCNAFSIITHLYSGEIQ